MARKPETGPSRVTIWAGQHLRALVVSLGRLWRSPLPAMMTAAVLGIALALPGGFLLLLDNAARLGGDWDGGTRVSLFLRDDLPASEHTRLAQKLRADAGVQAVTLITPEAALAEFRELSGFADALELLGGNPLPAVLEVRPLGELAPAQLEPMLQRWRALPEVAQLRLDREWLQRLQAMMQLAERGVWVIAALLGLAVILVIGNTIRLAIENRRDEIVITKLIGATDRFIRRPFLYEGCWYGVIGAVLAVLLIEIGRLLLAGPAAELAGLYGGLFSLQGLGLNGVGLLLASGAGLGWFGSWLAVGRHLSAIEPR